MPETMDAPSGTRGWRAPLLLAVSLASVGALVVVAIVVVTLRPTSGWTGVPPEDPVYPDLAVAPLADFLVALLEEGPEQLRFSASIVNIGPGPLIIRADRTRSDATDWRVVQVVKDAAGASADWLTPGTMVFGGHGHDHWHLRTGASYVLERVDGGRVQSKTKAGWCFFDQAPYRLTVPGALTEPVYSHTGCDGRAALSLQMGMSPGWGDPYFWQLEDQEVDITNVVDGEYRLWAYADPDGWLRETIETNNATWADVRLVRAPDGLRTVEVLGLAEAP